MRYYPTGIKLATEALIGEGVMVFLTAARKEKVTCHFGCYEQMDCV